MADEVDITSERIELLTEAAVSEVLRRKFEQGEGGDCDHCGYNFPRLVEREVFDETLKLCGKCRDLLKVG